MVFLVLICEIKSIWIKKLDVILKCAYLYISDMLIDCYIHQRGGIKITKQWIFSSYFPSFSSWNTPPYKKRVICKQLLIYLSDIFLLISFVAYLALDFSNVLYTTVTEFICHITFYFIVIRLEKQANFRCTYTRQSVIIRILHIDSRSYSGVVISQACAWLLIGDFFYHCTT